MMRTAFNLPLRQIEGLMTSVITLIGIIGNFITRGLTVVWSGREIVDAPPGVLNGALSTAVQRRRQYVVRNPMPVLRHLPVMGYDNTDQDKSRERGNHGDTDRSPRAVLLGGDTAESRTVSSG
jgi:hypothetical protein